jgi:tRNA modification GTPase
MSCPLAGANRGRGLENSYSPGAYGGEDPIAAPATSLPASALALIRTSGGGSGGGESAVDILARVFSRPEKLKAAPGNSIVHGWIVNPLGGKKEKIDEVLVSVYRSPRSYTGEDGADISCHGGAASIKAVMEVLKSAGFRDALAGEFSFRAFMNGKVDLTRAESVMELVSAKTGQGRERAVHRLAGALEKEIRAAGELVKKVLAGAELYLDYSEDEIEVPPDESAGVLPERPLAEEACSRLKKLLQAWKREQLYREGALAVIAGRPNAGKSSLFNILVKEERSIVTDIPGTTRDWIEVSLSLEGIPVRFADTAGLRNLDGGKGGSSDEAERAGIGRTWELLEMADLVIYVIDGEQGFAEEDRTFFRERTADGRTPFLVLWNKADIAPLEKAGVSGLPGELPGKILAVSAKTGEGIGTLISAAVTALEARSGEKGEAPGEAPLGPGTVRQKELIAAALEALEEALELAERREPLDLIAPLLRESLNALGEITGEVSTAEILETMFSRFCVGK